VVNNEGISMKLLKMSVRLLILACFVVGTAGCEGGGGGSGSNKGTTTKDQVSAPPAKPDQKKPNTAE
jgi:hypothetical protein